MHINFATRISILPPGYQFCHRQHRQHQNFFQFFHMVWKKAKVQADFLIFFTPTSEFRATADFFNFFHMVWKKAKVQADFLIFFTPT
jgi:hypothetical protein